MNTGIRLARQVLGEHLPPGWSVATGQMDYVHKDNVEFQVLTFHVIDPAGNPHKVKSDMVPARDDINALAALTAKKVIEGMFDDEQRTEPNP